MKILALTLCVACTLFCAISSAKRLDPFLKKIFDETYTEEVKDLLKEMFSEETDEYIDCMVKFMRKDKFFIRFADELGRLEFDDDETAEKLAEYYMVNYEKCSFDELYSDLKVQLKTEWPNESDEVIDCIIKKMRKDKMYSRFEKTDLLERLENDDNDAADTLNAYYNNNRAKCAINAGNRTAAHQSINEVYSTIKDQLKGKYPEESEDVINCTIKAMRSEKFVTTILSSAFIDENKAEDVIKKYVSSFYKRCKIPIAKAYSKENLQKLFPNEDEKIINCIGQKIQNGEFLLRISSATAATLSSEQIENNMREYINTSNAECIQESTNTGGH